MTFYSNAKQKSYVLNPRGKPLYEDANRFGTKMLEKMGWSKGRGLGANLDGEQNFIRVSHKTDQRGMGYEDRDDQWTNHENDFNSLLKSLYNSNNVSEDEFENNDKEVECRGFGFGTSSSQSQNVNRKSKSVKASLSGKSLEEMSKQSNSRVHYRKFTRGKDISKYSEKDLANIFGKKNMYHDEEVTSINQEVDNSTNIEESAVDTGMNIIETGTTINDYFMNKKNAKSKRTKNEEAVPKHVENVDFESNTRRRKKDEQANQPTADTHKLSKNKQKKREKREKESKIEEIDIEKKVESINFTTDTDQYTKKQKRVKKSKENDNEMASVKEDEINMRVSKSNTDFVETILTVLVNVNDSGTSSSTVLTQPDKDDADTENRDSVIDKSETQIYEINQFQAEIFRFVDLNGFPNANLSDICGYGVAGGIDLKITEKTRDRTKINDLWDDALVNKYGKDVIQAKKKKRYSIKALNKRKLFTGL